MNQSLSALKIEEKFDPRLIFGLYQNFKDPIQAILEIIDNAVDDIIKGKPMIISVIPQKNHLQIINKGGTGMGFTELNSFFIWGLSAKRGKLGRYGQGGKAAMGYLGKAWMIETTKAGEDKEYVIVEPNWDDREKGLKVYNPEVRDTKEIREGLVKINITNLKKKISKSDLKEVLSKIYRPLLKTGDIEIYSGLNERVYPLNFPLEMPEESFEFKLRNGKKISGWLSLLQRGVKIRGGIRCYCFGRLITEKEFFGPKDPSFKASIDRLIGEIYINTDKLPLMINKIDFDRASPIWEEIEAYMYKLIDPYIKLLLEEKDKDIPSEKEQKTAKYAGEIWAQFLRSLIREQKEGTLPGLPIDMGQKPPENDLEKIQTLENKIPIDRGSYSPATPPPLIKIGRRKRTGAFPEPELQSLPEPVRYEVTENNGRKIIKINTSFPIYKFRKNHQLLLYIWETLAIEDSKADDLDTQTVQDYIEETNKTLYQLGLFIKKNNIKIENLGNLWPKIKYI